MKLPLVCGGHMAKNSKSKGNNYERRIANLFAEEFNDNFRRVPMSGAFTGGINIHRTVGLREDVKEGLTGDIISPKWFPASVEAKAYADEPKFHHIVQGKSKKFDEWIDQCEIELATTKKSFFLLIFKINRKGEFVCFPQRCILNNITFNENFMVYNANDYKYTVITLESFLKHKELILRYKDGKEEEIKDDSTPAGEA